jgi:hypothetical protein
MKNAIDAKIAERIIAAVPQKVEADERAVSLFIGGLLLFGLALGGLAIGYATPFIQSVTTAVLISIGSLLIGGGIWSIIRDSLR